MQINFLLHFPRVPLFIARIIYYSHKRTIIIIIIYENIFKNFLFVIISMKYFTLDLSYRWRFVVKWYFLKMACSWRRDFCRTGKQLTAGIFTIAKSRIWTLETRKTQES